MLLLLVSEQWQHGHRRCSGNVRCHSVCWPASATISKKLQTSIKRHSCTPTGTDVDAELLSYISVSRTYVGDEGLAFWNSTSAFQSLAPFAQYLLAAPASQAYVELVFSVCGHLTAGKRNRLCKQLANRAFLKVDSKFYDWLCFPAEHWVTRIDTWNWNWKQQLK